MPALSDSLTPRNTRKPLRRNSSGKMKALEIDDVDEKHDEILLQVMDPHAAHLGGDLTSAVLGIIKAMVGPAILYLPHGFVGAGYAVAAPIMLTATALYLHSSKCLLETWKHFQNEQNHELVPLEEQDGTVLSLSSPSKQTTSHSLSYPDLAHRAFGPRGETAVKVGIALMQSGVCLTCKRTASCLDYKTCMYCSR